MVLLAHLGKDYRLQTSACELVVPAFATAFVFEAALVVAFVAASAVAYDNAFER